ncbi:hypothetical protein C4M97_02970 [Mycoplasmopsis pullorum]|uniref:hypothetical protein n=3 Tax=Mycoplasmopsis pullorum TaxID=48003 RepID=UPI001119F806|nr:hypothetical protein [Mycoplasmopsis pullorum]TNK82542.1 hypothetical protein C4M94_00620 [Mycoplasmopsis pullorum]TNK83324.1 hypothetical protein C4M80_00720 [Mycoplasmopsis pullorum]TNK86728.1 hypothetical protein C4M82_02415 [Mycoplasmopsis pullorum]TNK88208.1 hypothetical protein C4M89_03155 [Mycoplasmopsis pullorum]TNK88722.1 hypothetical protein C4M97_02970 [Mycoplasmopsis pullorum]
MSKKYKKVALAIASATPVASMLVATSASTTAEITESRLIWLVDSQPNLDHTAKQTWKDYFVSLKSSNADIDSNLFEFLEKKVLVSNDIYGFEHLHETDKTTLFNKLKDITNVTSDDSKIYSAKSLLRFIASTNENSLAKLIDIIRSKNLPKSDVLINENLLKIDFNTNDEESSRKVSTALKIINEKIYAVEHIRNNSIYDLTSTSDENVIINLNIRGEIIEKNSEKDILLNHILTIPNNLQYEEFAGFWTTEISRLKLYSYINDQLDKLSNPDVRDKFPEISQYNWYTLDDAKNFVKNTSLTSENLYSFAEKVRAVHYYIEKMLWLADLKNYANDEVKEQWLATPDASKKSYIEADSIFWLSQTMMKYDTDETMRNEFYDVINMNFAKTQSTFDTILFVNHLKHSLKKKSQNLDEQAQNSNAKTIKEIQDKMINSLYSTPDQFSDGTSLFEKVNVYNNVLFGIRELLYLDNVSPEMTLDFFKEMSEIYTDSENLKDPENVKSNLSRKISEIIKSSKLANETNGEIAPEQADLVGKWAVFELINSASFLSDQERSDFISQLNNLVYPYVDHQDPQQIQTQVLVLFNRIKQTGLIKELNLSATQKATLTSLLTNLAVDDLVKSQKLQQILEVLKSTLYDAKNSVATQDMVKDLLIKDSILNEDHLDNLIHKVNAIVVLMQNDGLSKQDKDAILELINQVDLTLNIVEYKVKLDELLNQVNTLKKAQQNLANFIDEVKNLLNVKDFNGDLSNLDSDSQKIDALKVAAQDVLNLANKASVAGTTVKQYSDAKVALQNAVQALEFNNFKTNIEKEINDLKLLSPKEKGYFIGELTSLDPTVKTKLFELLTNANNLESAKEALVNNAANNSLSADQIQELLKKLSWFSEENIYKKSVAQLANIQSINQAVATFKSKTWDVDQNAINELKKAILNTDKLTYPNSSSDSVLEQIIDNLNAQLTKELQIANAEISLVEGIVNADYEQYWSAYKVLNRFDQADQSFKEKLVETNFFSLVKQDLSKLSDEDIQKLESVQKNDAYEILYSAYQSKIATLKEKRTQFSTSVPSSKTQAVKIALSTAIPSVLLIILTAGLWYFLVKKRNNK